jgi:glutamate dehydrogenase
MYFMKESVEVIARHIMALYAAKIFAFTKKETGLSIDLEKETDEGAVYIHSSRPGISRTTGPQYEKRIDSKYLDISCPMKAYRLESYRSTGTVASSLSTQLRCYFVSRCQFVSVEVDENERDIRKVSDVNFLNKVSPQTLAIYQKMMDATLNRTGPVIELYNVTNSSEKRIVIAYRQKSTQYFFSALSDLYHYYHLFSARKYVEQFSNGVTIVSLFLNPLSADQEPPIESSILQVIKEASLIFCLPTTPLQAHFQAGTLSVQESIYGYVGLVFAQHFLNRLGSEYASLVNILNGEDPHHQEILTKIKKRLRQETFTREYILDIVRQYPALIRSLYVHFAQSHYMNAREKDLKPTISYQRLQLDKVLTEGELKEVIQKTVSNSHELLVFESFITFNKHVLKTNFYQPTKVALSFRLDPDFLPVLEYPQRPYGLFLVIGSEFRGFHLRFEDVARGGIRIIRSRNREAYSINMRSLFDENYALAATQHRKNKDIPESGSKGTILLDADQQDKSTVAFQKYVDSILDLLILGKSPGVKERIVDLYDKTEILFFGPDEGTADLMDWASGHAKARGATFWKAFTTGKSVTLGGIPHDLFGMTTHSVHQYVLGIYRKLGLREETIHKLQTGGPDGDLGSNEIKISRDLMIAIVDGSGVLYDPVGIHRDELQRLAAARLMISHFDTRLLSPQGFRILVEDVHVRLPNGTLVEDGLSFRNTFHLNPLSSADLFVPCGGRPEAVDIQTVNQLFNEDGTPRFK